jgi:hypothetical protein
MNDVEQAVAQLYLDEAIRDELIDDEANLLLSWGESQMRQIAPQLATHLDDWYPHFLRLLVNLNRFIGRRAELSREGQAAALADVLTEARNAGYLPPDAGLYLGQQAEMDNCGALSELLGWLDLPQWQPPVVHPPEPENPSTALMVVPDAAE